MTPATRPAGTNSRELRPTCFERQPWRFTASTSRPSASQMVKEVSLWQQLSPRNGDRRHAGSDFTHLPDFVRDDGSWLVGNGGSSPLLDRQRMTSCRGSDPQRRGPVLTTTTRSR
nr:hypothetical protein Itr_chr10CG15440 [Ipomoea trifida]